jgi:hypothetical protein
MQGLDSPVAAIMTASSAARTRMGGQRRDRGDRFGGPLLAFQGPSAAQDLDDLAPRARESYIGGHGGDLQGAPFSAAVSQLASLISDGDLSQGRSGELGVQAGLVALATLWVDDSDS